MLAVVLVRLRRPRRPRDGQHENASRSVATTLLRYSQARSSREASHPHSTRVYAEGRVRAVFLMSHGRSSHRAMYTSPPTRSHSNSVSASSFSGNQDFGFRQVLGTFVASVLRVFVTVSFYSLQVRCGRTRGETEQVFLRAPSVTLLCVPR